MFYIQSNILMSDDGTPLLADFGRSKFIDHRGFTTSFSGSARYLAPELVADEPDIDNSEDAYQAIDSQGHDAKLTKQTDVFAFSMLALEVSDSLSFKSSEHFVLIFAICLIPLSQTHFVS